MTEPRLLLQTRASPLAGTLRRIAGSRHRGLANDNQANAERVRAVDHGRPQPSPGPDPFQIFLDGAWRYPGEPAPKPIEGCGPARLDDVDPAVNMLKAVIKGATPTRALEILWANQALVSQDLGLTICLVELEAEVVAAATMVSIIRGGDDLYPGRTHGGGTVSH